MLTAAQIAALQDKSGQLLDPITDFLIEDIAKRVKRAGQFTATSSYNAWKLQELGISQKEIKQEIAKRLKISQEEAEKLLTQTAQTGYSFDMDRFPTDKGIPLEENTSLQQILHATLMQAGEDITNITKTMGFVGPDGLCRELTDAYRNACDFAFQKVSTGAQDYNSAIREATRNLAKKGIRTIDYKSGRHYSIEAAVRQNIMGGLGIMQEQISESNHDLLGCDGWEISAHAASAPDHEPIQGKQYTDEEYKRLNGRLLRPIGTLNCGHAAFPIIMGVNDPQYTEEELEDMRRENEEGVTFEGRHYTMYQATQRQRKYERAIREQKRKILVDEALEDKDQLQTDKIRLVRLRQEYARFSEGVDLPMQHARAEAAGFDWKDGKVAEKITNKKFKEILEKAKNGDKIVLDEDMESIIAGKPFEKIQPLREKLSDRAARRWYLAQDARIPYLIDYSLSLEDQARQACDLRNQNRTHARDLMRDQKKRKWLDENEPNPTFEELLKHKMEDKGLSYKEALEDIIKTTTKTRKTVNKQLGLG